MSPKVPARPLGLSWRSHTGFILASVYIGMFSDIFLYCLFVPILPNMLEDRAGLPAAGVQNHVDFMLAAYGGASVLFSPFAGWIADRTASRQLPFLCGLAALLAGTVLLYVAPDEGAMVAARVLQGVSSAVVWSVGLALCMDTVGVKNLGKAVGTAFSITAFGGLAGPPLGGALYEFGGYEAVFGAASAILVIDFVLRLLVIEKRTAAKYLPANADPQPVDPHDAERQQQHDDDTNDDDDANEQRPLLSPSDSALAIPRSPSALARIYPLAYCFRNPSFVTAQLLALIQAALLGCFDATLPTTAQQYFGFAPLRAGLLFAPLAVSDLIVGPLAGASVDRKGTKPAAVAAFAVLVPALVCMRFVQPGGGDQIALYCALLVLCGVGVSAVGSPMIVEASNIVGRFDRANPGYFGEKGPYAQLYGLNSMLFNLGLAAGPLTFGALRESIGYGNMNAVAAGMCAVGGILSFVYIGRKPAALQKVLSRHR